MANSRARPAGFNPNTLLLASELDTLDLGQYNALCRTGTTDLLGTTLIRGAGNSLTFNFSDNSTSKGYIFLGSQDFEVTTFGAGKFSFSDASRLYLGGSTSWPVLETHAITGYTPPIASHFQIDEYDLDQPYSWKQIVNTTPSIYLWLTLPAGVVIKSLSVPFKKTNGTWPFTMPTIALNYQDLTTGSATAVCSGTDTSANLVTFQTHHIVTTNTVSHTVATGRNYYVVITGDGDSSPTDFLRVYRPMLTLEISQLRTF